MLKYIKGDVAQLVEHLPEEQGVVGSIPTVTTKIDIMERTFNSDDLSWIAFSLIEYSRSMDYEGDLSDCGNEIGNIVGSKYKNMTEGEIEDFITGIRHGISLTNGTH